MSKLTKARREFTGAQNPVLRQPRPVGTPGQSSQRGSRIADFWQPDDANTATDGR